MLNYNKVSHQLSYCLRSFKLYKKLSILATVKTPKNHSTSLINQHKNQLSTKPGDETLSSFATNKSWNEEWKRIGLGARLPLQGSELTNILFVQTGFGVDQHGDRSTEGATKAAVRAIRNAIEFNSIPGVIEIVPGGRKEMIISVKLGVPPKDDSPTDPIDVDLTEIAKVFPYGRLMPIEVVVGGLSYPTGRIVRELGDENDIAICVAACITVGYDTGDRSKNTHTTYDSLDGH